MNAPPRSVLVVIPRRIGDVLLATPLIRSLKQAWPATAVDVLVFEGTQGALDANPDVRRIVAVAERPGFGSHLAFLMRLWRRYDVALSLVPGDRPTLYAFVAGRWRAGLLIDTRKEQWKRRLLDRWTTFDNLNTHTVRMHLALAAVLGIPSSPEVAATWRGADERQVDELLGAGIPQPIAVLHAYPKFNYKMWHRQGWIEIAQWLAARGFRIVLSGSRDPAELAYIADLARDMPPGIVNAAGRLSLGASAQLVSRARLYVGTDTALTHVAAALGVPVIALFGPSNPVKWGPWPRGHAGNANPWRRCGSQRVGNVTLLQGIGSCVPCLLEGCDRHIASFSDCLQQMPASRVIAAIEAVMGDGGWVVGSG
ncbi:MAG TPA: glycosyltransferase family 9 protein [Burkholderiales bacterium]|nr:glycosyltransferase family 9 protein [Burkholderiales bacterium]